MTKILERLRGTDRRSIGKSNAVVVAVLANPRWFNELFDGMLNDDPVIRMRAADAVEKITARRPDLLRPHKSKLIYQVARISQQEIRWHCAQLFSRLELTPRERRVLVELLNDYLNDQSSIVKTFAMQALADMAERDVQLRAPIIKQLETLTRTGTPAMKSRGRKLLARLQRAKSPLFTRKRDSSEDVTTHSDA